MAKRNCTCHDIPHRDKELILLFHPETNQGDPPAPYPGGVVYLCTQGDKERLERKKQWEAGRKKYSKDS